MTKHKVTILKNQEISAESEKFIELLSGAQSFSRNENFVSTSKKFLKNKNRTLHVLRYFT